jgi:hypothetical protein
MHFMGGDLIKDGQTNFEKTFKLIIIIIIIFFSTCASYLKIQLVSDGKS